MDRRGQKFGIVVVVGLSFLMGACNSLEEVLHDLEDNVGAGGASGNGDAGIQRRPPADAGVPSDGGTCVDNVLCIKTDHWDPKLCRCVPNVCVDNVLCVRGSHWNATACKCQPDQAACLKDSDCAGPLPQLCQVCSNGQAACAHWSCVSGGCAVATCPLAPAPTPAATEKRQARLSLKRPLNGCRPPFRCFARADPKILYGPLCRGRSVQSNEPVGRRTGVAPAIDAVGKILARTQQRVPTRKEPAYVEPRAARRAEAESSGPPR